MKRAAILLLVAAVTLFGGCSSADFAIVSPGEEASTDDVATSESAASILESGPAPEDADVPDTSVLEDTDVVVEDTTALIDSAAPDTTTVKDTAAPKDTSVVDSGTPPPIDTGTAPIDTGTAPIDTGTAPIDTGTPPTCSVSSCPGTTNPCKMPACVSGACGFVPKPKGTFCNGYNDQCDGFGNCVDCTDNGGCGQCCVCIANKCEPA
jgi:hypothetical protein